VSVITLQDYRQAEKKTKKSVRCPPIEGQIYAMTVESARIRLKATSKRVLLMSSFMASYTLRQCQERLLDRDGLET
jgi:hypothetical protein